MGASSDLGQVFRPRQKRWVWVREGIGFLAMTFALKEHFRPVLKKLKKWAIEFAMFS